MKNTIEFALRCPLEILGKDKAGNIEYRFDTRLIAGDWTIIRIMSPFATDSVARAKLYETIQKWD